MRVPTILLLLTTQLAFAQIGRSEGRGATGPQTGWVFGVQKIQPSLTASIRGTKDGKATSVDAEGDLGLKRNGSPLSFLVEYQGQSQSFHFTYESGRVGGDQLLAQPITLDGTAYAAGTRVQTSAKTEVLEGLWTLKLSQQADAWVGLDLGVQVIRADASATATPGLITKTARPTMPVPQIGLTGFSSGADGLLESRAFLRYSRYQGATCFRYGLDARAYLYPSFGILAYFEDSRMRVPPGSLQGDLDIRADRRVTGLGLVIRF